MHRILFSLLAAAPVAPLAPPVAAQLIISEAQSQASDTVNQSSDLQTANKAAEADALIATVGDARITAGDVQTAIAAFPPQLSQRLPPPQQISTAVDRLILRELILQHAKQINLSDDPAVQQLVEDNAQLSRQDAFVQVYIRRGLEGAVTDEAVRRAYDEAAIQAGQQLPPLEEARPQIEQQLRQQRLAQLRRDLAGMGISITFYDASGAPVEDGHTGTMTNSSRTGGTPSNSNAGPPSANRSNSGSADSNETESSSPN